MNITLRDKFPLLRRTINGQPLVYFDNAATTPKPQQVLDSLLDHYSNHSGNPGRSTHTLAEESAEHVERARQKVLTFLDAHEDYSVIFTKNATESLNLIAHSLEVQFVAASIKPTIIVTEAEHHSNLLPWQRVHKELGFPLIVIPIEKNGVLDTEKIKTILSKNPNSILAITHCSNVSGQVTAIDRLQSTITQNNITVILDASQSISHVPILLTAIHVDFLVASAHKMYGPEGVGLLVVKNNKLKEMTPLLLGGGVVTSVSANSYTLKGTIERFEAGTQNIAGIHALTSAIEFIEEIGFEYIQRYERSLTEKLLGDLTEIPEITVINGNNATLHAPVVSFYSSKIHAHDIADELDKWGIAVRAGNHCAQPFHQALGINGSVRVSLSFYNTAEEIDYFILCLKKCLKKFA